MAKVTAEIINEVKKSTIDNRLSCAKAHEIAEKLEVPLTVVGQAAEELKVKISKCQLGCF